MGTGVLPQQKLYKILEEVKHLPGDYAEVGVANGASFKNLVPQALKHNKKAWAFDSFKGMDKLTNLDHPRYPEGRFNVGGVQGFISKIPFKHGIDYYTREGFIPHCFKEVDTTFSFIYLDVDTYTPTKKALPWLWNHLTVKGYFLFDDYFKEGNWGGPSEAINEFLSQKLYKELNYDNNQLLVQKL